MIAASDEEGYDVVSRTHAGTTLYIGMNTGAEAKTVSVPVSAGNGTILTDLYGGKMYTVSNGTVQITIPSAADGGTVILKKVSSGGSSSGSSSSGSSSGESSPAGSDKADTKDPAKDTSNVTDTKTETVKDANGRTSEVTVKVEKDAQGAVVNAQVTVNTTGKVSKNKLTGVISGKVTAYATEATGMKNTAISVTVSAGKTSYTVNADAQDLKAGNQLKVVAIDPKTNAYVLVNAKTYTVKKNGDVSLSLAGGAEYQLVTKEEAAAIEKAIVKTIKPEKSSVTVKPGKKTTIKLSDKLNMDNVSKVTYTSGKKSVANVSKNGKVTAKKAGTASVKVKVTLKNGTKKTVTVKVKVK